MASLVEVIARQALSTFSKSVTDESFTECFLKLVRTVNQLKAKDVNFSHDVLSTSNNRSPKASITYIEVLENPKFTMGIFVLKSGAKIPLHDHPGMHGILKVIKGTVKVTSYSLITSLNSSVKVPKDLRTRLGGKEETQLLPVESHEPVEVTENDDACVLRPITGNFHEIKAVTGSAAFVDILAPPYDMRERDCHYYLNFESKCLESAVKTWLLKTSPPCDFFCDSAPYHGPEIDL